MGTSALFRFAASPFGQRVIQRGTEFLYENASSVGANAANAWHHGSEAVERAYDWVRGDEDQPGRSQAPAPVLARAAIPMG